MLYGLSPCRGTGALQPTHSLAGRDVNTYTNVAGHPAPGAFAAKYREHAEMNQQLSPPNVITVDAENWPAQECMYL